MLAAPGAGLCRFPSSSRPLFTSFSRTAAFQDYCPTHSSESILVICTCANMDVAASRLTRKAVSDPNSSKISSRSSIRIGKAGWQPGRYGVLYAARRSRWTSSDRRLLSLNVCDYWLFVTPGSKANANAKGLSHTSFCGQKTAFSEKRT
jgi:hypothetical protein